MAQGHTVLTVYFDDPFWAALIERETDGGYEVARHVFGAEPTLSEIEGFVLSRRFAELRFTPAGPAYRPKAASESTNPKRKQREAARAAATRGISTCAQQALKAGLEEHKKESASELKQRRQVEADEQWQLRREKAKRKKRGH